MIIGSHVSFGKEQLLGSAKEAITYNANTFMFYTGAPQNTLRKPIDNNLTLQALELMKDNNIDIKNVICHAPYIVNLANRSDASKWDFSINFLKNEINRCEEMGIQYIVVHPGSAVGITREEGLQNIVDALNIIITPEDECIILLETMAGKGNELGRSLEEIKYMIDKVNLKDKIGVCLDTCHLNDAGYDVTDFDLYLDQFDELIGIDKIKCIHINDSKNEKDSHKDRHANLGYGTIGFDNMINIIYNERIKDIPKILETPYVGKDIDDKSRDYPPYRFEIEMIKNKTFNEKLIEDINNYYN